MKKSRRFISFLLVGILSSLYVSSALNANAEKQEDILQPNQKITAELTGKIEKNNDSNEKMPVYI